MLIKLLLLLLKNCAGGILCLFELKRSLFFYQFFILRKLIDCFLPHHSFLFVQFLLLLHMQCFSDFIESVLIRCLDLFLAQFELMLQLGLDSLGAFSASNFIVWLCFCLNVLFWREMTCLLLRHVSELGKMLLSTVGK